MSLVSIKNKKKAGRIKNTVICMCNNCADLRCRLKEGYLKNKVEVLQHEYTEKSELLVPARGGVGLQGYCSVCKI